MRKILISLTLILLGGVTMQAQRQLTLQDVAQGAFSARGPVGMTPVSGTDEYLHPLLLPYGKARSRSL